MSTNALLMAKATRKYFRENYDGTKPQIFSPVNFYLSTAIMVIFVKPYLTSLQVN